MEIQQLTLSLPPWLAEQLHAMVREYPSLEERMRLVISMARENVERCTGGPFAAAVFHCTTGKLISVGVNRVVASTCSLAHAEMIAIGIAQQSSKMFDLASPSIPAHQLVTSAEPCIMCLGAIHWSGVQSVAIGARDEDVRAIGFDEGPKPPGWKHLFLSNGIEVVEDVLRTAAVDILEQYVRMAGRIYNPSNVPARSRTTN